MVTAAVPMISKQTVQYQREEEATTLVASKLVTVCLSACAINIVHLINFGHVVIFCTNTTD